MSVGGGQEGKGRYLWTAWDFFPLWNRILFLLPLLYHQPRGPPCLGDRKKWQPPQCPNRAMSSYRWKVSLPHSPPSSKRTLCRGCTSVAQNLPSMCETLVSIPIITKTQTSKQTKTFPGLERKQWTTKRPRTLEWEIPLPLSKVVTGRGQPELDSFRRYPQCLSVTQHVEVQGLYLSPKCYSYM